MNSPLRILYVDDSALDRELVRDALTKEKSGEFLLTEATSRLEFEAKLTLGKYDLVLSDFNILGFDGLKVLDRVQALDPPLPVIIVTGTGNEEIAVEAMKRGVGDYVIKTPSHIQRLPQMIRAVLEKQSLARERLQRREVLRQAHEQLSAIVQESPQAVVTLDLQGNVLTWNPAAERLIGWREAEALGKPFPLVSQGKTREFHTILEQALRGEKLKSREIRRQRRDGSWLDLELHTGLLHDKMENVSGLLVLLEDITERKQAENEIHRLNQGLEKKVRVRTAQLESTNKELEAFAYSVSHDLRAPLRGIDGWSLALLEDNFDQLDEQGRIYLERVRSEVHHMGQLIDDMLTLSRVTRADMETRPVDLTSLAQAAIARLRSSQPDRQVEVVIQPGLTASGDGALLAIVLTNLLDNAWKFTGKCSQARIEFGQTAVDGHQAFFVRDNGVGFDMAYVDKLFRAFQRLHKASEFPGTGVGLATVQRIIRRHGGRVWVEAQLDSGATFFFTLEETL